MPATPSDKTAHAESSILAVGMAATLAEQQTDVVERLKRRFTASVFFRSIVSPQQGSFEGKALP
jgi:hypothetical protein